MSNFRLLYFADSGSGVSHFVSQQVCAIKKRHEDTFAVISTHEHFKGLIDMIENNGIDTLTLSGLENHKNFMRHSKLLHVFIKEKKIDIVHVQTNWELILVAFVKFVYCSDFKIVYTIHNFRNNYKYKKYIAQILITFLLWLFTDKVICLSKYMQESFKLLDYKIIRCPLGAEESYFDYNYNFNPSLGVSSIYAAVYRQGKRHDVLIKAFARYLKDSGDSNSKLYLPGDGPMLNDMKKLVGELGVERSIIFPGKCQRQELLEYYDKVNIGVVPSISETFGFCIVEPFILGKCVLTTSVGVAGDIITNATDGFYFNTEDELYQLFYKMGKEPITLETICRNNYNKRDHFRWSKVTESYLLELEKLT